VLDDELVDRTDAEEDDGVPIGGRQITSAAKSQSLSTFSGRACERKPPGKTTSTVPCESRTTCQLVITSPKSSRMSTSVPLP
jgi:hypothetical protein